MTATKTLLQLVLSFSLKTYTCTVISMLTACSSSKKAALEYVEENVTRSKQMAQEAIYQIPPQPQLIRRFAITDALQKTSYTLYDYMKHAISVRIMYSKL